jgi:hypothetical protein
MSKFKLIIGKEALDVLTIFIETVSRFINNDLAVSYPGTELDSELKKAWEDSLRDSIKNDSDMVLDLVNGRENDEELVFDESAADAMLRLCSAIRLKMYQVLPEGIENYSLDVDADEIPDLNYEQQKIWRASQFLAGFQMHILHQLDPEIEDHDLWSE